MKPAHRLTHPFVWVWLIVVACLGVRSTQEMPVPVSIQYQVFLKVLAYDRDLKARAGEEVIIGVVYEPRFSESLMAKQALMAAAAAEIMPRVNNLPVRLLPIEVSDNEALEEAMRRKKIAVLYVSPLKSLNVNKVAEIAQTFRVVTMTGVPEYVTNGLAVGVTIGGQRPQVLINLKAARAEGANFNAQLLRLARVVGG